MLYCRLVGKALEKKGSESKSDYSLVLAKLIERLQLKEQLEASVSDESEEVDMRLENLAHTAVCIIYQTLSLPPFLSLSLSLSHLSLIVRSTSRTSPTRWRSTPTLRRCWCR